MFVPISHAAYAPTTDNGPHTTHYGPPLVFEEDFAYILTTFPLLDRDQPALPDEPKSTITRDLALLALFKLRGKTPPADIVDFFAAAGADISGIT